MKKHISLLTLLLALAACGQNSTQGKFEIEDFYQDVESKNFTVDDGETAQVFYNENALLYQTIDQGDFGVVKMPQGIFEIHENGSGGYEVHGMLTPNTELDILDGCHNFHDIVHIPQKNWKYVDSNNTYYLEPSFSDFEILETTGYFSSADELDIEKLVLTRTKEHEYKIDVLYYEDLKDIKSDYTIIFDNYQQNKNTRLENFMANTTVTPQTDWNEYQQQALETAGFSDLPFLNSFTIGLKMTFIRIAGYASGGYACAIYDCMSSVEQLDDIRTELESLGFHRQSDNAYYKESSTVLDLNLNVAFAYIDTDEIQTMIRHGEAQPGDLLAYPYGYMQYVFAYSFAEKEINFETLNTKLTNIMKLPEMDNTVNFVNKVTAIEYADNINEVAVTDEEYIALFEELGEEPGPIYEEISSIYLYIDDENDAINYIDSYRGDIRETDYQFFSPSSTDTDDKSIADMSSRSVEYYKLDDFDAPKYVLDIYLFDSSGAGDYEYNGVVEIVITKYTDLGLKLYYSV